MTWVPRPEHFTPPPPWKRDLRDVYAVSIDALTDDEMAAIRKAMAHAVPCVLQNGEPERGQSRRASAAEAVANVAIGYGVAVAAQAAIFPAFGIHVPASSHLAIGAAFTAVSLVRSYALRRLFNAMRGRWA